MAFDPDDHRFSRRFVPQRNESYTARVNASRGQPVLPIFGPPPAQTRVPEPLPESPRAPPPAPSSGEKARARDIIAAIRTLKAIEAENRVATNDERDILARFGGFGAVALSIFPDPVSGRYKPGWQEVGDELKGLLTPEEYDSAKRTTFNAFYTSPTVMAAMHEALGRLGVPDAAIILEPGCGTGNFLSHASPQQRFIGVEMDSISGRIAQGDCTVTYAPNSTCRR